MSEPANLFGMFRKRPSKADLERKELLEAINSTQDKLNRARISFNNVSDPELVDASIYEINSLQAHYSYLLRKAKEQGYERLNMFKEYSKTED